MEGMFLLKGSRLRRNLLAYVFTHPDGQWYVRELSLLIREDPGNLSRELRRLEAEGLFSAVSRGVLRFYSLNRDYRFLAEVGRIIARTEGVEGSLRRMLEDLPAVEHAFIYGSFADGTAGAGSDVDLVVVGDVTEDDLLERIRAVEGRLGREVHVTRYARKDFAREKRKQGGFLALVLKQPRIILKGSADV